MRTLAWTRGAEGLSDQAIDSDWPHIRCEFTMGIARAIFEARSHAWPRRLRLHPEASAEVAGK